MSWFDFLLVIQPFIRQADQFAHSRAANFILILVDG
jgi:hypothetical protein